MTMPIWIPLVVLAAAVLVGIPFADYLGMPPIVAASTTTVTAASAITVLLMLGLHAPVFAEAGWFAWAILLGPTVLIMLVWAGKVLLTSFRRPPAPAGRCAHCALLLFTDYTGRRYVAHDTGYLCPPQFQQPGHRRHRLARVGAVDGARPGHAS